MRLVSLLVLSLGLTAAVAPARTSAPRPDPVERALAGKQADAPKDCLSPQEATRMSVYDGTVLFRVNPRLVYKNDLNGCDILREDDILQTNLYGTGRLCRGDIAQIINRAGRFGKGACSFGEFVPYRAPR